MNKWLHKQINTHVINKKWEINTHKILDTFLDLSGVKKWVNQRDTAHPHSGTHTPSIECPTSKEEKNVRMKGNRKKPKEVKVKKMITFPGTVPQGGFGRGVGVVRGLEVEKKIKTRKKSLRIKVKRRGLGGRGCRDSGHRRWRAKVAVNDALGVRRSCTGMLLRLGVSVPSVCCWECCMECEPIVTVWRTLCDREATSRLAPDTMTQNVSRCWSH